MIPQAYITEWRNKAPWQENYQVEQDLVIERALVEIYSDPFLKERLAFRGGTALHKLHLSPQVRYSEDIDLVQINAEPFGPIIDKLRDRLSWLGKPVVNQKKHNNTMIYRFESEDGIPIRLKVETNCREHFTVMGIREMDMKVESSWFTGVAQVPTYDIHELLGTKLRALYQRKKGRDLFDMWDAMTKKKLDGQKIIEVWNTYMQEEGHSVSQQEFIENMEKKVSDQDFLGDMKGLLRIGEPYDIARAYEFVKKELLEKIINE
jgi:predicted nucleotidyltransferase component of viral defense system